jgi:hypothetical protein
MASSAMAVMATGPLAFDDAPQKATAKVALHASPVKQLVSRTQLSGHAFQQVIKNNDLKVKKLVADDAIRSSQPSKAGARRSAETANLYESFEDYDGNVTWLPDGWSVESKNAENENPWSVGEAGAWFAGCDGSNAAFVNYSDTYCDEYLITKSVTVKENEELSFMAMLYPVYFYSMDNLDFDTYEYDGDKIVVQTVKVLISEDDGETWTLLNDFAETYKDGDFMTLYSLPTWSRYTFSLADYVGKTIKIAFEYVGTDGNTNGVDAVSVDLPAIEVSYSYPYYTQFFGLSADLNYLPYTIAVEPVFSPLTWYNTSDSSTATYTWSYFSPDNETLTETGTDFTMTYHTCFDSEFTTRNNLYYPPTLTGSAPGAADGSYSRGNFFQAGGKAQFKTSNSDGTSTIQQFGLCSFDVNTEGLGLATEDLGATPLFGYSPTTDAYWTAYSFGEDNDDEGNYAFVDGIINVYLTSDAPLVINGGWVLAYTADLDADHEFTFEVCPLTDEGEISDAIASTTIKGSDVVAVEEGSNYDYSALKFEFDEPAVISSEICSQYIVRLTGIHECGEYFAPFQSTEDNPEGTYHGFVQKTVSWMNTPRTSLTALVRLTGENTSFAIMLDAEYPWLQSEEDEVSLDDDNTGSLALNSYYDGADFTVDAPEWLSVSVSGIYDECVATFTADSATADATETEVTLSVPGYSKTVTVKDIKAKSGISAVKFDATKEVKNYFNLSGVNFGNTAPTVPGVYMARYADGTVAKVIVK